MSFVNQQIFDSPQIIESRNINSTLLFSQCMCC